MQCVRPMPFRQQSRHSLCTVAIGNVALTSFLPRLSLGDSLISPMSTLGTDVQDQEKKQGAKRKREQSDSPPTDAGEDEGHDKLSRTSPAPRRRPIKRTSLVGDIAIHVAGTEEVDAELRNAVSYLGSTS